MADKRSFPLIKPGMFCVAQSVAAAPDVDFLKHGHSPEPKLGRGAQRERQRANDDNCAQEEEQGRKATNTAQRQGIPVG